MTREDGTVLTYAYDSLGAGRVVGVSVSNAPSGTIGTTEQTFSYDGLGRMLAATDNNEPATTADDTSSRWVYDSLGRVIEESQKMGAGASRVVSHGYSAYERASLVYPNGRSLGFGYHYPSGPLRTIYDTGAASPIAKYDYLGERTLVRSLQNGMNLDIRDDAGGASFDAAGQPTRWPHRAARETGGPVRLGFEYAYDLAGNKQYQRSESDPLDSQRYSYDSADRLAAFQRGPFGATPQAFCGPSTATWHDLDVLQAWDLDGLGNWSSLTHRSLLTSATVETRTDTTMNAYASVGGVAQTHDPSGNLTADGKRILKWDAFGRLREARTTTGTLLAAYYYDAAARRVRKDVFASLSAGGPAQPTRTDFFYAGWQVLQENTVSASAPPLPEPTIPTRQFVWGNYLDEALVMDVNGGSDASCTSFTLASGADSRYFYHQNALGSVCALSNAAGAIVEAYEYDPHGRHVVVIDGNADGRVDFDGTDTRTVLGASAVGNPVGFTGQRYDAETQWYCHRLRFYDPVLGVFVSVDPIGFFGGVNVYGYVDGNPLYYTDPYGLSWATDLEAGINKYGALNWLEDTGADLGNWGFPVYFVGNLGKGFTSVLGGGQGLGQAYEGYDDNGKMSGGRRLLVGGMDAGGLVLTGATGIGGALESVGGRAVAAEVTCEVAEAAGKRDAATTIEEQLKGHLDDALARFEEEGFTLRQRLRIKMNPKLEAPFRGERIHTFFNETASEDQFLLGKGMQLTPRFRPGPDVYFQSSKGWFDVTTPGEWAKHIAKYEKGYGQGYPLLYTYP